MKPKIEFFKSKEFSSSDIDEVGAEKREAEGRLNKEEMRNVSPVTCCFGHMMPADYNMSTPSLTHGERLLGQLKYAPMDIVSNIHLRMGHIYPTKF